MLACTRRSISLARSYFGCTTVVAPTKLLLTLPTVCLIILYLRRILIPCGVVTTSSNGIDAKKRRLSFRMSFRNHYCPPPPPPLSSLRRMCFIFLLGRLETVRHITDGKQRCSTQNPFFSRRHRQLHRRYVARWNCGRSNVVRGSSSISREAQYFNCAFCFSIVSEGCSEIGRIYRGCSRLPIYRTRFRLYAPTTYVRFFFVRFCTRRIVVANFFLIPLPLHIDVRMLSVSSNYPRRIYGL